MLKLINIVFKPNPHGSKLVWSVTSIKPPSATSALQKIASFSTHIENLKNIHSHTVKNSVNPFEIRILMLDGFPSTGVLHEPNSILIPLNPSVSTKELKIESLDLDLKHMMSFFKSYRFWKNGGGDFLGLFKNYRFLKIPAGWSIKTSPFSLDGSKLQPKNQWKETSN